MKLARRTKAKDLSRSPISSRTKKLNATRSWKSDTGIIVGTNLSSVNFLKSVVDSNELIRKRSNVSEAYDGAKEAGIGLDEEVS